MTSIPAAVERLSPAWDALADELDATPFHRPGWVLAWCRAFGRGSPEVLMSQRGGELAAVLPLDRLRRDLGSASDLESPLFGPLARHADDARTVTAATLARRPRSLSLWMIDPADPATAGIRWAAADARYRMVDRTILRSPRLPLAGGWEGYRVTLPARFRREIRRRRRRLSEQGELRLDVSDGTERLERFLAEGFALEGSGWKEGRGTAIRSRPAAVRFYTEVARWAAERGWLRLAFLRLDRRAIAFDYCLEWGGIHALVKTGYDPALGRFAPGQLLREAMLERAFEHRLSTYEFLGTDDPWKAEWTGETVPRVLLQAFAPSLAGSVWWGAERFGRPMARRVRGAVRDRRRRR